MLDSVKPANSVSIIGCGDIGCRVARLLSHLAPFTAHSITGFTHRTAALSSISQLGIGAIRLDLDNLITNSDGTQPKSAANLAQLHNQLVFYFAPSPKDRRC